MQSEMGSGSEAGSDGIEEEEVQADIAKAKAFAASLGSSKPANTSSGSENLAAAMAELDMDNYDNSCDEEENDAMLHRILGAGNPGMAYHRNPEDDPYLRKGSGGADASGASDDDDDDDTEAEDLRLRESDLLIMAARNEEDISHLEVWIYEEPDERGDGNLYVHHAVLLPAFPLALAWMDCSPAEGKDKGNFAAVASFEPGIELWDLDVIDAVEPVATLGGVDYAAAREAANAEHKKAKKKKKGKSGTRLPKLPVHPGSHEDAVLGLAWNPQYRNVLASASADKTVKVWDISTQQVSTTMTHHQDKVQAVAWNPTEGSVLLSGGFDRRVCLADMRAPETEAVAWELPADVEALAWDPHSPTSFAVSLESGEIVMYDARGGADSSAKLRLAAHNKAATAVSFSPGVKNLFLTASTDKRVKVWGISDDGQPGLLAAQDLKVGAVFGAAFCKDAPMVAAVGGAKGELAVWDTATEASVADFAAKIKEN
jgi:periodic tryptophan protein 1